MIVNTVPGLEIVSAVIEIGIDHEVGLKYLLADWRRKDQAGPFHRVAAAATVRPLGTWLEEETGAVDGTTANTQETRLGESDQSQNNPLGHAGFDAQKRLDTRSDLEIDRMIQW